MRKSLTSFTVTRMKVSVDLPEEDLKAICRVTGLSKKGPAIRKLVTDALMLRSRAEVAGKFVSGEWGVDLKGFEVSREKDRIASQKLGSIWRD